MSAIIPTVSNNTSARYVNADLHCHTLHSDGRLTVAEILVRAQERGVELLSITDHDSIGAYLDPEIATPVNLKMVSGIEVSAQWRGIGIHIVGLGFRLEDLSGFINSQSERRMERAHRIARLLEKKGAENVMEQALKMTNGAAPGRLHFARIAVSENLYQKEADAFKKLLGNGKPGDVKSGWPDVSEAVKAIVNAGGIAVIAHPHKYKMTNTKLKSLLEDFTEAGGRGLEICGTGIDTQKRQYFSQLCIQFNLLGSRGSDFHGPEQTWCDLGKLAAMPEQVEPIWNYLEPLA